MRFLIFAAQYLPTAGGVERYTQNLANTLVGMGHAVTVATSALPGLENEETTPEGVNVVRLPAYLAMGGRFPIIKKNRLFRQLAARLFAQPYSFAVINTRFYPLSLWAAGQCRRRGLPALVLEHGTKHLSMDNAVLNLFGNAYEHAAMRLVRRRCADFYGVSQACVQWLQHFKVQAKGVLYNAVDAAAIRALAEGAEVDFRARLGLEKDAPVVSFVGRFIAEKGVWELLEAFALLRKHAAGAALVMAGDGPLLQAVREKAPAGVHLVGLLPYEESVALMAQGDIFCLPTYSEGFSSTILEAAAVGACIVTTPTGGSPELIEDGMGGLLLKDKTPETIADALKGLLANEERRAAMGRRVQREVEDRFTWRATAEKLVKIAEEEQKAE